MWAGEKLKIGLENFKAEPLRNRHLVAVCVHLDQLEIPPVKILVEEVAVIFEHRQLRQLVNSDPNLGGLADCDPGLPSFQLVRCADFFQIVEISALPNLSDIVAGILEVSCADHSHFVNDFEGTVFAEHKSFPIVRKVFGATMLVTTVILEDRFRFRVSRVHSSPFQPTLATVAAHRVMGVNFAQFCPFFDPNIRFNESGACLGKNGSFEICLRSFQFLAGQSMKISLEQEMLRLWKWPARENLEWQCSYS